MTLDGVANELSNRLISLWLKDGKGERPFAKRFVEILDTLARSKKFWVFDVNAHEILAKWHLPREQPALAARLRDARDAAAAAYATATVRLPWSAL